MQSIYTTFQGRQIETYKSPGIDAETPYLALIDKQLNLSMTTRPDISYAVGLLSRYMQDPTEDHWKAAKHVLPYLRVNLR
jgi:hypothetical protein